MGTPHTSSFYIISIINYESKQNHAFLVFFLRTSHLILLLPTADEEECYRCIILSLFYGEKVAKMVWKYFLIGLVYSVLLKITLERKHIKSYVLNLQIVSAVFKRKKRKAYLFLKVHVAQWRCLAYRSVQKSKCVLYSFAIKITFQFAAYHCIFKMLLALCNMHDPQLYLTSILIFEYISGIARNLVYKILLIHNQILPGLVTNIYTPHLFCLAVFSIPAHPEPF